MKTHKEFAVANGVNAERFWKKVDVGDPSVCWVWLGCKDPNGYGRFHVTINRNSVRLAHRIAFGLVTGESPEAVCHRCDNTSCCNPSHLFGGTRAMNNRDMADKGRNRTPRPNLQGENHHMAKLENEDVLAIRDLYAVGNITQRQLAAQYNVCQRTINKAVRHIGFKNAKRTIPEAPEIR